MNCERKNYYRYLNKNRVIFTDPSAPTNVNITQISESVSSSNIFCYKISWKHPAQEIVSNFTLSVKFNDCDAYSCFTDEKNYSIKPNNDGEYSETLSLKAFLQHSIKITAENDAGTSTSEEIPFETPEGIPSKPVNLKVDITADNLIITWENPLHPTGKINNYTVRVYHEPFTVANCEQEPVNFTAVVNENEYIYDNNRGYEYTVIVYASNTDYAGESSQITLTSNFTKLEPVPHLSYSYKFGDSSDYYNVSCLVEYSPPCNAPTNIYEVTVNEKDSNKTSDTKFSFGMAPNTGYTVQVVPIYNDVKGDRKNVSFASPGGGKFLEFLLYFYLSFVFSYIAYECE